MFLKYALKNRATTRISLVFTVIIGLTLTSLPLPFVQAPRAAAQVQDPDQAQIVVIAPGSAYRQTNWVSDSPGVAFSQEPLLVNPWGISKTASSPFWISNNGTSTTQLFRGDVAGSPITRNPSPSVITIPPSPFGLPTGTVANPVATEFVLPGACAVPPCGANFLFASLNGNITGWDPNAPAANSTTAVIAATQPGHVYTGLAHANNGSGNFLYAADFANGTIDVFNTSFALQPAASFPFADPTIPTTPGNTYHPYNIQAIGGSLYVVYAKVGAGGLPEDGVGNGFVRRFNANGVRDLTFGINNGALNSPWGITIAAATFGIFGGALLVGNFGEGNPSIHAYNPTTGAFLGTIQDESGNGIVIDELWALDFGNGGSGGNPNTLYFTAGIGEEEHGLFGSLNPTTASATSLIQFGSDDIAINESAGHVDITVTRAGDVSNSATVNYATFDQSQPDHASQKTDFQFAAGTLKFAPGETSKTFRILIVNDTLDENDETIDLYLTNPSGLGLGLGSPNVSELEILDNDTGAAVTNPIDDPAFFVRQHYLDFYNREPDSNAAGLAAQLTACGADTGCILTKRREISTSFFGSNEYMGSGSLIARTHQAAFGPNGATNFGPASVVHYGQFQIGLQAILKDVAIGPAGAAQLETNKQAFFEAFVLQPEFVARFASTLTPAQFVDQLLTNAGFTATPAERQAAIDEFGVAGTSANLAARARALRRIAENATFTTETANENAVRLGYFGYFRRDPETAAFNFLVNRLDSFGTGNRFEEANLVNIFLKSAEYRQRFGTDGANFINNAPVAVNDMASTDAITPVMINVLGNDSDVNGDFLTITSVTPVAGANITISADRRSLTFTPSPGFAGNFNFQYTVADNGFACTSMGGVCGPAPGVTQFAFGSLTDVGDVTVTVNAGGTFQLSAASTSVSEGAGKVSLTVTLTGGVATPVSVDYSTGTSSGSPCATVSGVASDRCDFNTAIGVLRFAQGDSSKTIDIFITDDSYVEGDETFTLTLSNVVGSNFSLGATTVETVTITDNDVAPSPTNPIDTTPFFVRQQYVDFLNREPDAGGFTAWVNLLNGCSPGDTACDRVTVSQSFFGSNEFKNQGYFAIRAYRAAFGRISLYTEFVGDVSLLNAANATDPATDKATYIAEFVQRAEFHSTFDALTNAQFVDKLIANSGVTFPTAQRDQWVSDLNALTKTRAQVLQEFIEDTRFVNDADTLNRAFVLSEYFGYLRRDPDTGGFNAWVAYLTANPGDFRTMVRGFVDSVEYRRRFGPN